MQIMPFNKVARLSAFPLALIFLAALVFPVSEASAGIRICKSQYTGSRDRQRLRLSMQQVLPARVSAAGIPSLCLNRGYASAWLSTWPRLRPDGVTEWWDIDCQRRAREWACESPTHRQLIWVYAQVGGILRRLEVSFDESTELARARSLSVKAMQILQDPTSEPLPACDSQPSDKSRLEWRKTQSEFGLTPQDTAAELSVEANESGAVEVIKDGTLGLRFTDGSGLTGSSRTCWAEWIIVG